MKKILAQLQDAVPDSYKGLLSNRLATTRNKSFPEKTGEIAQSCGDTGRALLEAYPDLIADINKCRTRAAPELPPPRQEVAAFGLLALCEDENLPPCLVVPGPAGCPGWTGYQWTPTVSDATADANSWWERIGVAPYLPSRYRLPIASCLRGSRSARG